MALIVETGEGLATAESYNSVAEITTYNAAHRAVATWDAGILADQERWARLATQYMTARWNERARGYRVSDEQALFFPREGIYSDEQLLPASPLPKALKDTHAELSIRASAGELIADLTNEGSVIEKTIIAGPVEKTVKWSGSGQSQTPLYRIVESLMRPLVYGGDVVLRG